MRKYDVVLWGATGFTGKLVAEYLVRHASAGLRWALGGRNEAKLAEVRRALALISPAAGALPLAIADATDEASLDALVASTRVVATTVGPFRQHGPALVAAAARNGTHYCDLTGEPQFVREMIDLHHATARESGAKIVHCAGFDSIPSDLGVLMMQEHALSKMGRPLESIRFVTRRMSGGVSGGTIASALLMAEEMAKDKSLRRKLANPYLLDPTREGRGPDRGDQQGVKWDEEAGCWTAPFVMAAINTRIVRRTNSLLGYRYGRDFRYSEVMGLSRGVRGAVTAAGITAGLGGFFVTAATRPGRAVLRRFLPGPGEGPSTQSQQNGHFHIELIGSDGMRGHVSAKQDPGYGATAMMFGETALGLAEASAPKGGGVLTPASVPGLGMTLVERLRQAGMTFDVAMA